MEQVTLERDKFPEEEKALSAPSVDRKLAGSFLIATVPDGSGNAVPSPPRCRNHGCFGPLALGRSRWIVATEVPIWMPKPTSMGRSPKRGRTSGIRIKT